MENLQTVTWKADPITGEFVIYEGEQPVGFFSRNWLGFKAKAEWKGKNYRMTFPSWSGLKMKIVEEETAEEIAYASFNLMSTKANVRLFDGSYMQWKYNNYSQNKWQISDEQDQRIEFKESWNRGKVLHQDEEASSLQMMIGLMLHQYLWNMRVFVAATSLLIFVV
ncbi:MAG: hypothetical protein AAFY70_00565 [Bacteroidota bacterium]